MKKQKGTWKIWAVVAMLSAFIVAAMVEVNGRPVLNITKKGTKELIVVDAGHGGIQTRPKKSGLAQAGGWWESCADVGYTHLSYKQSIQGVNL